MMHFNPLHSVANIYIFGILLKWMKLAVTRKCMNIWIRFRMANNCQIIEKGFLFCLKITIMTNMEGGTSHERSFFNRLRYKNIIKFTNFFSKLQLLSSEIFAKKKSFYLVASICPIVSIRFDFVKQTLKWSDFAFAN